MHDAKLTPSNPSNTMSEALHFHTFQMPVSAAGSVQASTATNTTSINIEEHHFIKTISQCRHADWDTCEMTRLQELNEARQRASQMENTMRWWTQCTAIWRQKWQTVRHERNRVRDELARTRTKLNEAKEEIQRLNDENFRSETQAKTLASKIQQLKLLCPYDAETNSTIWDRIAAILKTTKNASLSINPLRNEATTQTESFNSVNNVKLTDAETIDKLDANEAASRNPTALETNSRSDGGLPNTPEQSPPTSSEGHSSYSSAKSVFFTRLSMTALKHAEFTTTGETPSQTPMYHYGGGGRSSTGRARRRNSLC